MPKLTNTNCPNCGRPFDGFYHPGDACDVCGAKVDGMADPGRAWREVRRRESEATYVGNLPIVAAYARSWARDCDWSETEGFDYVNACDYFGQFSDAAVVKIAARHYDGGLAALTHDALEDAAPRACCAYCHRDRSPDCLHTACPCGAATASQGLARTIGAGELLTSAYADMVDRVLASVDGSGLTGSELHAAGLLARALLSVSRGQYDRARTLTRNALTTLGTIDA
jgi:hypothetical protein